MVLTTGTVLAQAIGYLITPFLTRIYTTEDFGDFGMYMRAIGFLSTLATVRYELAIPLPKQDSHSFLLYRLSLRIALYMLSISLIIGILYGLLQPSDQFGLAFIVITVLSSFFVVFSNIGTNWAIRMKHFKSISMSKMVNSISSNGLKWIFGLTGLGSLGLLLGSLVGYILSCLPFSKEFTNVSNRMKPFRSESKTLLLSRQYKEFPYVSLPHALIDMGRDLVVATLIIAFFSKSIFGSYSHSYAMMRLPLIIVGTSIGQVFYNRCSEMINNGKEIYTLLRKTILILLSLSIIPFGLIFFFGEEIFAFVFGEKWADSGRFSEIMSLWLLLNFVMSPISNIPMILKRQKAYFVFGLISTVLQLGFFSILPLIIGNTVQDFENILYGLTIAMILYHIFVIWMSLYFAKLGVKR